MGILEIDAETLLRPVEPGDHEKFSHYVNQKVYDLTAALINGTPVIALCGKEWIPTRDPERFPICPDCREILDTYWPEA